MSESTHAAATDWTGSDDSLFLDPEQHPSRTLSGVYLLSALGSVAIIVVLLLGDPGRVTIGYLSIGLILLTLVMGVPVAIAITFASLLGLYKLGGYDVMRLTAEQAPFSAVIGWELSVIPMFVFMGTALWRFNLTDGPFVVARQWLGRVPGGLAIATNLSGAGLAASSGSTIGISYALGRIAVPEMLRAQYKPSLAVGVVAAAGTIGQIIPPSITLVIYAGIAQVPVGPQLIAGVIPGMLLALTFSVTILAWTRMDPTCAPPSATHRVPMVERLRSLVLLLPVAVLVLIVVGGMFGGVFTPTEAGAFACLATLVIGGFSGRKKGLQFFLRTVALSARDALPAVAMIFFLIIAIKILTRLMALSGIVFSLTEWVIGLGLGRVALLLTLMLILLVLGMFMDGLTMMLLTVPILAPVLATLDVDMLWFGVFLVLMVEVGMLTPPVGILGYVVHKIVQDPDVNVGRNVSIGTVFAGVTPFVIACLAVAVVMILIPEIVTWLPEAGAAKE